MARLLEWLDENEAPSPHILAIDLREVCLMGSTSLYLHTFAHSKHKKCLQIVLISRVKLWRTHVGIVLFL